MYIDLLNAVVAISSANLNICSSLNPHCGATNFGEYALSKYFSVNKLTNLESVKIRLEREQNLSFLEFNYSLLQAFDFLQLSKNYNCKILTTEKDFFRSKNYMSNKIEFISSRLEVLNEEKLFEALTKIYEQN